MTHDEWPRITISWLLQFFYKTGYIIGWTILVAMFVSRYGIGSLPYFLILYATFRIISAFIYSNFINQFRKDIVILFTALIGCLVLVVALVVSTINTFMFILLATAVLGMFFSQLYILITAFVEELFSPLESERTFPIIESAETIGGIIAGLIISFFSSEYQVILMVYLMIALLLLIVPIIISHRQILKKLPFINFKKKKILTKVSFDGVKETLKHMKQMPFLKVLVLVMFSQWIFSNLLEFQYTNAVYEGVKGGGDIEKELTHGLGSLQILFHSFALLMQLFVASRIISSLGVVGSLLLHPIVTLFSLGTLLLRFGFAAAVVTKVNFEMTNIVYLNAYHTSYYAIEHKIREQFREILEGFVQPIGALVGTILLIIIEQIFSGGMLNTSLTFLMIGLMIFIFLILLKNENKYSHISVKNLVHSNNTILQLNAVEVLGQKGHRGACEILTKTLKSTQIDDKVRIKIIDTLGHMHEQDAILELLDSLNNKNPKVRLAALKAINKLERVEKDMIKFPFSHYRINDVLQNVFSKETDSDIKKFIIQIIAKMNKNNVVPFILSLFKTNDKRTIIDAISVCSHFDDINLVHYLLPFLESEDPVVRSKTICALWQFKQHRSKLLPVLEELLYSIDVNDRMAGYSTVGKINAIHEKNRLKEALNSENAFEKLKAAVALCDMRFHEGITVIVDSIMSNNCELQNFALNAVDGFHSSISRIINNLLLRRVSAHINFILAESNKTSLEELDSETLFKLRRAYDLVNDHEEVQNIDDIISKKNTSNNILEFNPA